MAENSNEPANAVASSTPIDYSSRARSRHLTSTTSSQPHADAPSTIPHTCEPGRVDSPPLQILEIVSTIISSEPTILETYRRWSALQKQLDAIIASNGIRTAARKSVELVHCHIEKREPVTQGKLTMLILTKLGRSLRWRGRDSVFELRQLLDANSS